MEKPTNQPLQEEELQKILDNGNVWGEDLERLVDWYQFYVTSYRERNQELLPLLEKDDDEDPAEGKGRSVGPLAGDAEGSLECGGGSFEVGD